MTSPRHALSPVLPAVLWVALVSTGCTDLGKDDFVDADAFYLGLEPGHDMHGFRSHGIYASGQLSVALLTISWVLSTTVAFSLSLSPCRRDEQFLARWRVVFTPLILMSMLTLVAGVLLFFWMRCCVCFVLML